MQVLAGVPEHRDNVLTESERNSGELIAVCVSRANSQRLVLDYY
jgi:vanillate O-demethylase ferredoxin subunit